MPKRHELTEAAWAVIAPLLPADARQGERWRDHRTVIKGILWKLTTGVPWRDLPARDGPWQTCHSRLLRWQRDGTWAKLLRRARQHADAVGEVVWGVGVDSTVVRAHQHAAGAPKRGPSRRRLRRPTASGGAAAG